MALGRLCNRVELHAKDAGTAVAEGGCRETHTGGVVGVYTCKGDSSAMADLVESVKKSIVWPS